jgi:hypothetical protein
MNDEVSSAVRLRSQRESVSVIFRHAEGAHFCFWAVQDMLIEIDELRAENQDLQLQALASLRSKWHLPAQVHF